MVEHSRIWISHLGVSAPGERARCRGPGGSLQEAQEAELGAGSGIASPDHGARQLLPELLPYTLKNHPTGSVPLNHAIRNDDRNEGGARPQTMRLRV